MTLARRLAAEALGTAFLLAVVVGSGIMGERLAAGNAAIALLANSIATGCGLWVLITIFGPISGAHFNPAVTLAFAISGEFKWGDVLPYHRNADRRGLRWRGGGAHDVRATAIYRIGTRARRAESMAQ